MKRVIFCVATRDRKYVLHQLLWSLRNQTYPYWDLVIVDDGVGKFSLDSWERDEMYKRILGELRKEHRVQVIPSEHTNKVGAALQRGYLAASEYWDSQLFCRADDDHWLPPEWLEQMVKVFDDDSIACASSLVLDPGSDIKVLKQDDPSRTQWNKVATIASTPNLQWMRHENLDLIDVEHVTCPMIMRSDVLKDIGGFDTYLFDHFREESYHSWRFYLEGHRVVIAPWVECWHLRAPTGGVRGVGKPLDDARKFNIIRTGMKPGIRVELQHGMGDLIAATPAIEQIKKEYPDRDLSVYHPFAKEVFANNPNVDYICKSPTDGMRTNNIQLSVYQWMHKNKYSGHISNAYCNALAVPELTEIAPKLYGIKNTPQNHVILVSESNAKIYDFSDISRTKHWNLNAWESLAEWLVGDLHATVIQLSGPKLTERIHGTQLVNNLSYRESFRLISGARCVICIDTMAGHAAAALGVPSVVLFGRTNSSIYGYSRHNVRNLQGNCPGNKPCNGGELYLQDRKQCAFHENGFNACMKHSVDEVKAAVSDVIDKRLGDF